MAGGKPKLPLSREEVLDAASKLEYLAKRYTELAAAMENRKVDSIQAGNLKTLQASIGHIINAVNQAFKDLDATITKTGVFAKERSKKK